MVVMVLNARSQDSDAAARDIANLKVRVAALELDNKKLKEQMVALKAIPDISKTTELAKPDPQLESDPDIQKDQKHPAMEIVRGTDLAYTIQIPAQWTVKKGAQDFDSLANYKSIYIGVIAEEANLGSPETIAGLARDRLKEGGTDLEWSQPKPLSLDGRNWLQFSVDCKVNKIPISYQYYVYAGREGTFQIVGWTTQDLSAKYASTIREVAQTFRFPK